MLHERKLGCSCDMCYTKTEGTELGGIKLQRYSLFFQVGGHVDHLRVNQTSWQQWLFGSHVVMSCPRLLQR